MSTDYTPDINMESALQDDSYTSTQTNEPIPVQGDNKQVEDPMNASSADSDEQLEQDDREAIDKSNIIEERTRGAKPRDTYKEPGDKITGIE
ncbi:hypothetical protein ACSS6W_006143 [Trichoderma asperelloides]|nr:hypothetical protein LI328DRAFT_164027 [Trichoderma asperelloides]